MIDDPLFYLAAVPAVLIAGISKGGFGAGVGLLAVPMMALVLPPVQAAAIMLPILCLMDVVGIWAYWKKWEGRVLLRLALAAGVGIAVGALTFHLLAPWSIRLLILVILAGFIVWLEPTRVVWGWLRGEAFYQGRPTSYWAERIGPWRLSEEVLAMLPRPRL